MTKETTLFLVDSDMRRRAAISHCLAGSGIHVEPFEDIGELIDHGSLEGMLLVNDDEQAIPKLLDYLEQSGQWMPVIGFAQSPSTAMVVKAMVDGAIDYLSWPFDASQINQVACLALEKAETFGGAKLREAAARNKVDRLSRREREVLTGVAGGMSNRSIAEMLAISPRTVEIHRSNMISKMGVSHTSDAIRIAIEANVRTH